MFCIGKILLRTDMHMCKQFLYIITSSDIELDSWKFACACVKWATISCPKILSGEEVKQKSYKFKS